MHPLLFVDGYNVIGAWEDLEKHPIPIDQARDRLSELLEDYAGYTEQEVILVFDGHQGSRPTASIEQRHKLTVIFTKHGANRRPVHRKGLRGDPFLSRSTRSHQRPPGANHDFGAGRHAPVLTASCGWNL